jgi:hypothetical protein
MTPFQKSLTMACLASAVALAIIVSTRLTLTSPPRPAPDPRVWIVVDDRSLTVTQGQQADNARLIKALVRNLHCGDRLRLIQMFTAGARDGSFDWQGTAPASHNPAAPTRAERDRLAGFITGVEQNVDMMNEAPATKYTDIFSTLNAIAGGLRAAGGEVTVYLLTDMEQSDHQFEMARGHKIPSPRWLERQVADHLLPDLTGACIVVVGADATRPGGVAIRDFWKKYFAAAHADFREVNYAAAANDLTAFRCSTPDRSPARELAASTSPSPERGRSVR